MPCPYDTYASARADWLRAVVDTGSLYQRASRASIDSGPAPVVPSQTHRTMSRPSIIEKVL
jgi:hypothetical protein